MTQSLDFGLLDFSISIPAVYPYLLVFTLKFSLKIHLSELIDPTGKRNVEPTKAILRKTKHEKNSTAKTTNVLD